MEEKLKAFKIIHIALVSGVSVVYVIVGDVFTMDFLKIPEIEESSYVYLMIPIAAVFMGNLLFKKQLQKVDPRLTLKEKLPTYQAACIIRWAILEGAALLLLFLKREFIIIGLFLILYLAFLRPSLPQMKNDLNSF